MAPKNWPSSTKTPTTQREEEPRILHCDHATQQRSLESFCALLSSSFFCRRWPVYATVFKDCDNWTLAAEPVAKFQEKTSCARGDTICPRPSPHRVSAEAPRAAEPTAAPAEGNVAAVSHAQYVPTLTAIAACA